MQCCALCNHCRETSCIGKHFGLIWASHKVIGDETLIFWLLLVALVRIVCTWWDLILALALDIDWGLWSYPVFGWSWAWFLRVTSLFGDYLAIESMWLVYISTEQIVVLLSYTERIWWLTTHVLTSVLCQALGIRTCWSLLCRSWAQASGVLTGSEASLPSLISLVSVRSWASGHTFAISHRVTWLHSVVLIHLIIESSRTNWSTRFENTKLLLVQYLTVGKSLVIVSLSEIWGAHHLLRHH